MTATSRWAPGVLLAKVSGKGHNVDPNEVKKRRARNRWNRKARKANRGQP